MTVNIEDEDLKSINAFVELAQKELNESNNAYKELEKAPRFPRYTNIAVAYQEALQAHQAALGNIKKKYAKKISNVCSRILK
jgi:hypothetical protein